MANISTNLSIPQAEFSIDAVEARLMSRRFIITTDSASETAQAMLRSLVISSAGVLVTPFIIFFSVWARHSLGQSAQLVYAMLFFGGWLAASAITYILLARREKSTRMLLAMKVSALSNVSMALLGICYVSIIELSL